MHEIYRGWRQVMDEYEGQRAFVAEAWVQDPERLALYVRPDELHTAFNFQYLRAPWEAAELRQTIDECLTTTHGVGRPDDLGAVQPRRHPPRHALWPSRLHRRRCRG